MVNYITRNTSYNSELTSLPIVTPFAENRAKVPPTCRCGAKHGNDVSSSFVIRKFCNRHIFINKKFQNQPKCITQNTNKMGNIHWKKESNLKNYYKVIYAIISLCALAFPIGYLLRFVKPEVAFPTMFFLLGCQNLFYGLFLVQKEKKFYRLMSIILGSFFVLFSIFFIIPSYYL